MKLWSGKARRSMLEEREARGAPALAVGVTSDPRSALAAAPAPQPEFPHWRRSVTFIALGAGVASFSMNFWVPFLPLYMRKLGATSDEQALFWVAVGMSANGVFRLFGGPLWGMLADRYGRKRMFVRSLFAATVTTIIAAFAREPWHVSVAWACQGFFSGFIPAAVAFTSVSVPKSRLTSGLGTVQGAQYAGSTLGPALGAIMAGWFGLRGAIMVAAIFPALVGAVVLFGVARDETAPRVRAIVAAAERGRRRGPAFGGGFGLQFCLGLLLYFAIFVMSQLVRTAAPVAIGEIQGHNTAAGATGLAFTVAGLASVVGALGLARFVSRPGWLRLSLTAMIALAAVAHVLLGAAGSVVLFTVWFSVASLAQGAMLPATNTVIATSVPLERRGTAFGLASSIQALAFIVGPLSAAAFAAFSLQLGFTLLGVLLAGVGVVIFLLLREPALIDQEAPPARAPAIAHDHARGR